MIARWPWKKCPACGSPYHPSKSIGCRTCREEARRLEAELLAAKS